MTTGHVGKPIDRIDGRAKVTGAARYAAEWDAPGLAHGHVVSSSIARGRIVRIDSSAAVALPGVLGVFSHENNPLRAWPDRDYGDEVAPPGTPFRPLFDDEVRFSAQPVALVVAESSELARHAASLVRVDYAPEPHATDLEKNLGAAFEPRSREGIEPPRKRRGDPDAAFARAEVRVEAEYRGPTEHHNPMEPFAATAVWQDDGTLAVWDKTQGVQNVQQHLCNVFGCSRAEIRVLAPFVGGAFGSGLRPKPEAFLAVMAARELKRSVRVALTRQQMFSIGHRPATWQRVALGATRAGKLEAIRHEAVAETSSFEEYSEPVVQWSGMLYRCDDVALSHHLVRLDVPTPCDMRAPGAAWGLFALECAMDELAIELGIDPVALRLGNYSDRDQNEDKPFSSKELRACYRQAADAFGWARRDPRPCSMRAGNHLIGWGMASAAWDAMQRPASAKAVLTAAGRLTVSSATADIGTGTYTIMTQIAADQLGLPLEAVAFELGDSKMPAAPVEGGSFTAASVGSAVVAACRKLRETLFDLAVSLPGSPLSGCALKDVTFGGGELRSTADPSRAISITDVLQRSKRAALEEEARAEPSPERERHACYTHSAIFAEVKVDADFGTVRATRIVTALAGGRILNPKTARSQVLGAIVGGIGMALHEESVVDHALGRVMTHNLADYHVPVNADVEQIEVIFVEEHDDIVNPLGAKGLGEIGIVGVAAAIANAVHHATGVRVRDLPIGPSKLVPALARARS